MSCTDEPGLGNRRGPSCSWFFPVHRGRLLSEDALMRLINGPGVHASSHAWQVLMVLYGCTGKGAHREVLPMFIFQNQTAKSAFWKHHGHSSSGAGPPWLSMPGTWEGPGRKCSGDHRPFHQVCSGICNKDSNCTNDCKDPMGQIYCPLWATQKDSNQSGMKFLESVGGWPLWVDGGVEDMD